MAERLGGWTVAAALQEIQHRAMAQCITEAAQQGVTFSERDRDVLRVGIKAGAAAALGLMVEAQTRES